VNWKTKAAIQRWVGALPDAVSYPAYYALQRTMGGLRHPTPSEHLIGGLGVAERIWREQRTVRARRFLEIGTGRQLNLPIGLWLCGAASVLTVDLNPYLKASLVFEHIDYMRRHASEIDRLFAQVPDRALFAERFGQLLNAPRDLDRLCAMIGVTYLAPADATRLDLPPASIDYHISFTVLEHIPPPALERIVTEGCRVLAADGRFVHYVDFSDHFAHADPSLSLVNFLQFSEDEWAWLAGNRYAYHNRLRVDEFAAVVERGGAAVLSIEPTVDARSLETLRQGHRLDPRFAGKPVETNATVDAWLVASPGTIPTAITRVGSARCG
jgi:SAM-dependent methyltransferase